MWAYQNFFCFAKTFTNLFRKKLYQKPLETERRKHRIYISPIENKTSGFYFDLRSHTRNEIKRAGFELCEIRSRNCWAKLEERCNHSLRINRLSRRNRRSCCTILERESGLKCGIDFKIGYSPERINPGDEAHDLTKITKIVAGMDEETTEDLAELYGLISTI
jgi:hypothetical protein